MFKFQNDQKTFMDLLLDNLIFQSISKSNDIKNLFLNIKI